MRSATKSSDAPAPVGAARGVEAHDLVEADAEAEHRRRQVEEIGELAVPGGQREIAVEHRDALARVVERVLQQVAARLDRRRGVVEQFQRRLARHRAPAQQQRQHQARGRGADRRRRADARRGGSVCASASSLAATSRPRSSVKRLEGAPRARGAEIARDRRLEFAHRRRGAPQAERLRLAARRVADEGGRPACARSASPGASARPRTKAATLAPSDSTTPPTSG